METSTSKDDLIELFERVSKTDLDTSDSFEDLEGDSESKFRNYQSQDDLLHQTKMNILSEWHCHHRKLINGKKQLQLN